MTGLNTFVPDISGAVVLAVPDETCAANNIECKIPNMESVVPDNVCQDIRQDIHQDLVSQITDNNIEADEGFFFEQIKKHIQSIGEEFLSKGRSHGYETGDLEALAQEIHNILDRLGPIDSQKMDLLSLHLNRMASEADRLDSLVLASSRFLRELEYMQKHFSEESSPLKAFTDKFAHVFKF